jgi:threonine dehydrogenase-like Zn-dependent dehydrogenase
MDETTTRLIRRSLEAVVALAAATVLLGSLQSAGGQVRAWPVVVLFACLVLVAENAAVILPSSTSVSPGFMLVMAAITVLDANAASTGAVVAGAGLVGCAGGLLWHCARDKRWAAIVFNCGQLTLAAAAASALYTSPPPSSPPSPTR